MHLTIAQVWPCFAVVAPGARRFREKKSRSSPCSRRADERLTAAWAASGGGLSRRGYAVCARLGGSPSRNGIREAAVLERSRPPRGKVRGAGRGNLGYQKHWL